MASHNQWNILTGLFLTWFIFPEFKNFLKEAYTILTSDNEEIIST
jgi:hypothetical protein